MSPAPISSKLVVSSDYKYILVNTTDDGVLAELPFQNVSYSNVLNEAGSFSGDIPVNLTTSYFDLYNSTIPGLTSIYVLRGDVCVWGGIVSGRTYSARQKTLNVTADQFVSYLDRRVLWKTWSTRYGCRIDISDMTVGGVTKRVGKVTLLGGATFLNEEIVAGKDSAFVSFGDEKDVAEYSGTYTVLADPAPDTTNGKYFYFGAYYRPADKKNFIAIPVQRVAETSTSVEFQQTTKKYLKNLIRNHFNDDTYDLSFASDAVAASRIERLQIAGYSRTDNVVTMTIDSDDGPHNLVVGQRIAVRDISAPHAALNREKTVVTEIVDSLRFKYETTTSGTISPTTPTIPSLTVDAYQRANNIVTVVTNSDHGLQVGDLVSVTQLDSRIDGTIRYNVTSVGKVAKGSTNDPDKVFQFECKGPKIGYSNAPSAARVRRIPVVQAYTGGPFKFNSDIGIVFNDETFEGLNDTYKLEQDAIRGYELLTFKEIIDKYAQDEYGFDYRIDCSFDSETNLFSKQFKFLPLKPVALDDVITNTYGGVLPDEYLPTVDDFGATNLVFEYPGNISDVEMTETVEEGATRVWAQGTIEELSDDASQPYAGIGDTTLLNRGWPIFDKVIRKEKLSRGNALYSFARSTLGQAQLPVSTFQITVNGSLDPVVSSYKPGDWCIVIIDDLFIQERLMSYYENKGDPTRVVLLRKVAAVDVTVPINPGFPEVVTLTLVTEPGIDINGEQSKWRWPSSRDSAGFPNNLVE
jgi:hypothetical protein